MLLLDNAFAVVVPVADDPRAVSVASGDASLAEVHSADSRHDAVSDPELVAAVDSSPVSDFASGDAADDGGVDVVGLYAGVTVFVARVPAPAVDEFADVVIRP